MLSKTSHLQRSLLESPAATTASNKAMTELRHDAMPPQEQRSRGAQPRWQILDVTSIWMKEFASALAATTPFTAWCPSMSYLGHLATWQREEVLTDPPLTVTWFPLQRGYARTPVRLLARYERSLLARLRKQTVDPANSPLICSTPFYAPVAEQWPGPVIYYVTDLTASYATVDRDQVIRLDRRMCEVAASVCPNSRRIAHYLQTTSGCDPAKLTIVPNATRATNIASAPLLQPGPRPADIAHLPGPIAGVIGNLSANMDWLLLAEVLRLTPHLSWVFVGPTDMPIAESAQQRARAWVMQHAHFTGPRPYGDLQAYARCFEVAILPYRKKEPTYSGSSTRFYEHLAACRPMVATRGFAELLEKEPLVTLVDTSQQMQAALETLHGANYQDGLETLRWKASQLGTWEERARTLKATLRTLQPA